MFEEIVSRKVNEYVSYLPANKSHITLMELLAIGELEKFIKIYLLSEVSSWIHLRKMELLSDKRFHFPKGSIDELLQIIDNTFLGAAKFDTNQLFNEIESAIKLQVNYLCRPKTTLIQFIFSDQSQKSILDMHARLNYFSDYEYLKDAVRQMFSEREEAQTNGPFVTVYAFEKCINDLDAKFSEKLDTDGFIYSIYPLIKFFNKDFIDKKDFTLPVTALLLLADDRQLSGLYTALYEEYENGRENISSKELKLILNNIFTPVI